MDNRKKLNDVSIALIVLAACDLFSFFGTLLVKYFDGTFESALPEASASVITIAVIILLVFGAIVTGAQILIGYKGYKESKNPTGAKGYITAAYIFWVIAILGVVTSAVSVFKATGTDSIVNGISVISVALDVCIYGMFITEAKKLRKSTDKNA